MAVDLGKVDLEEGVMVMEAREEGGVVKGMVKAGVGTMAAKVHRNIYNCDRCNCNLIMFLSHHLMRQSTTVELCLLEADFRFPLHIVVANDQVYNNR